MAAAREKGVDAETIASLQILVDERTARISQSASSAHPAGGAA